MPRASGHPVRDDRPLLRRLAPGSLLLLAVMGGGAPAPLVVPSAPLASRTLASLVGIAEPPPLAIAIAGGGLEFAVRPPASVPAAEEPPAPTAPCFVPQSQRFLGSSCDPPVGAGT